MPQVRNGRQESVRRGRNQPLRSRPNFARVCESVNGPDDGPSQHTKAADILPHEFEYKPDKWSWYPSRYRSPRGSGDAIHYARRSGHTVGLGRTVGPHGDLGSVRTNLFSGGLQS